MPICTFSRLGNGLADLAAAGSITDWSFIGYTAPSHCFGLAFRRKWRKAMRLSGSRGFPEPPQNAKAQGEKQGSQNEADAFQLSPAARGREHPDHAGSGGRIPPSGDALFDRQGFVGHAASGDEGVLPVKAAVPDPAYRYHLEVPGDDPVSRCGGQAARARADRAQERAGYARRHLADHAWKRALYRHHEDAEPEAGAGSRRLRCSLRRGAARRGEVAGEGTSLFLP